MFEYLTLGIIKLYVNLGNIFLNTPYVWDNNLKTIKITKSPIRKISFYLAYIQSICYLCFLVLRLLTYLGQEEDISFVNISWLFLWINFYIWAIITIYNDQVKNQETVALFKGLQKLTREFHKGINNYHFCTFLYETIYFYRK
jgi:hypothetical protein